ncbi:kelch-like protein 7 isoform X1 [Poecilia reticulata]|uniref:kelch-like protein 7 isoform X1 n=1 Tax=Poecilia reticulata TaxID=8081 RepID=UPI0004A2A49D|nr:PREDICTED: kelch-like protein 7 isoform X1 [Poecilia reticulata]XP_008411082.1 PREDICTED: kelch-like protein 7 isoform X1 [Poecilia reticulata]
MASKMEASTSKKTVSTCRHEAALNQLTCLVKSMDKMRKLGELSDVTLVVQGRRFPVHRLVLAAGSEYFRLMFTGNLMESESPEVSLHEVEPEIVEMLINYIYTAKIELNNGNVQSLLHAASQYLIEPVTVMCEKFLQKRIDITNCFGMWALAHSLNCEGLKVKAEGVLLRHFRESSMLTDFLQLHVTCLTSILRNDRLRVSEEQIYGAALRWLNHDLPNRQQHLVEVLSCVHFPLLSKDFLSQTVQPEPLIADSPHCLSMVTDAIYSWRERRNVTVNLRAQLRNPPKIALFGHLQPDPCRYFNPQDSKWTAIPCSLEKRWNATSVYWNHEVYILGGSTCQGLEKRVDCYDILLETMHSRIDLPWPRNKLAACVFQGKIYASGGMLHDRSTASLFTSFHINTNSWEVETSLLSPRCCHGSVEVNGLIYVCGGGWMDTSFKIINTFEVYNPSTRQWMELHPMYRPRKNHGLVWVGNWIYAIGGKGHEGFIESVERYNIRNNYWFPCESMPLALMVKCVAINEIIYVLAGKGKEDLRHILKYNTRTDRWKTCYNVKAAPYPGSVVCVID